jgi:hypothetical protein
MQEPAVSGHFATKHEVLDSPHSTAGKAIEDRWDFVGRKICQKPQLSQIYRNDWALSFAHLVHGP